MKMLIHSKILYLCDFDDIFQDEVARLALCENQQYQPIVLMLGMIGCSIPASLKAEFFCVLAAYACSPEVAINLWQLLEMSQIVQTVKPMSVPAANTPGGIQVCGYWYYACCVPYMGISYCLL